jgi:hypothetical protein
MNNKLSPKSIILHALKKKFEGTGIIKLVIQFNVKNDQYNIMVAQSDNKPLKLQIDEKDMSMMKTVFVKKLEEKIRQEFKRDFTSFIIEFDFKTEQLNVFVQDIFKEVTKFDY